MNLKSGENTGTIDRIVTMLKKGTHFTGTWFLETRKSKIAISYEELTI